MSEIAGLRAHDPELLRLLARGLSLDAYARRMHESERTVRRSVTGCGRLVLGAFIHAVVWAARH